MKIQKLNLLLCVLFFIGPISSQGLPMERMSQERTTKKDSHLLPEQLTERNRRDVVQQRNPLEENCITKIDHREQIFNRYSQSREQEKEYYIEQDYIQQREKNDMQQVEAEAYYMQQAEEYCMQQAEEEEYYIQQAEAYCMQQAEEEEYYMQQAKEEDEEGFSLGHFIDALEEHPAAAYFVLTRKEGRTILAPCTTTRFIRRSENTATFNALKRALEEHYEPKNCAIISEIIERNHLSNPNTFCLSPNRLRDILEKVKHEYGGSY